MPGTEVMIAGNTMVSVFPLKSLLKQWAVWQSSHSEGQQFTAYLLINPLQLWPFWPFHLASVSVGRKEIIFLHSHCNLGTHAIECL